MGRAARRIIVNADVCSGCRACQVACVAHHEGRFGVSTARIRVSKDEARGIDRPHVCRLCGRAPCIEACPVRALQRDDGTGTVIVDAATCTGCAACVDACPFGMAALDPATGIALICDLCGGRPACVARCATGAIRYSAGEAEAGPMRVQAEEGETGQVGDV